MTGRRSKPAADAPLFDWPIAHGKTDTSSEAADRIDPLTPTLRERCYALVQDHCLIPYYGGLTADEAAGILNRTVLAIRPRFTELKDMGKIKDSGKRRKNDTDHNQIVWNLAES